MLDSPAMAEGAGLAARRPGQLLVGVPRAVTDGVSPVCYEEYRHLKDTGLCGRHPIADFVGTTREKIPLAYFAVGEERVTVAR